MSQTSNLNQDDRSDLTSSTTNEITKKTTSTLDTNDTNPSSSSGPSISSSSFNSLANSSSSSASSSPTNNNTNQHKKKTHSKNFNDPLLSSFHSNYCYFMPPMFGFPNMPYTDMNMSYPYMKDYNAFNQQLLNYSNYPTYFPADYTNNWSSQSATNGETHSKETSKSNSSRVLTSNQSTNQTTNENQSTNNTTYYKKYNSNRKSYGRRQQDANKTEEAKPAPPVKPPVYNLMQNEQVYTNAFPALSTLSIDEEKSTVVRIDEIENNENKENKENINVSTKSSNSCSSSSSSSAADKRWSDIVTGNRNFLQTNDFCENASKLETDLIDNLCLNTSEEIEKQESKNDTEEQRKTDELKPDNKATQSTNQNGKRNKYNKNYNNNNYRLNAYQNQAYDFYYNRPYYNYNQNYQTNLQTTQTKLHEFDKSVLDSLNPVEFYFNGEKENSSEARFFVIKSNSREDVLLSIKHGIWCSTKYGNTKLNQAYNEAKAKNMSLYLYFSVNTSGLFCGLAEMTSNVDFDAKTDLWAQDKWKGKFDLKWIFVKDVPNSKLKHIILPNNENKPVTHSRDAQEIPFDKGVEMLNVFRTYQHTSTIFDETEPNQPLMNTDAYLMSLMMNYNYTQAPGAYKSYSSYKPRSNSQYKKINNNHTSKKNSANPVDSKNLVAASN